jgi:hypothetical protein
MCTAPAAPPGRSRPGKAIALGVGILGVWGPSLAVCFDEAFDKLVDIARLG